MGDGNGRRFAIDVLKKVAVWATLGLIAIVGGGLLLFAEGYVGGIAEAKDQAIEAKVDEAVTKATAADEKSTATAVNLDTHEKVQTVQMKALDDKVETILWLLDPGERKRSRRRR